MIGITVTVTRNTVSGQDAYGNDVLGPVTFQMPGCAFQPGQTSEATQGADETTYDGRLFYPQGYTLTALDQVLLPDGNLFDVQGQLSNWESPFTLRLGMQMARLRQIVGGSAHTVSAGAA